MIKLSNISKSFGEKTVLDKFSLNIDENEFVTIVGKSGSGKTTLLNIIGLLEKPDEGQVEICSQKNFNNKKIQFLRRYKIGYIFQNYALLENETVKSNLMLATKYTENFNEKTLNNYLKEVELSENILNKKVYQLSGGEQQRVALLRTLIKPCDIILADEPTGNLDIENKEIIIKIFLKMKKTIVCVTHDEQMAKASNRIIYI